MKVALSGTGVLAAAAIAAVGVASWWLYKNREKFNPASDQNFAYQGANAALPVVGVPPAAEGGEDTIGGVAARFREMITGTDARIRALLAGSKPNHDATAGAGSLITYDIPAGGA